MVWTDGSAESSSETGAPMTLKTTNVDGVPAAVRGRDAADGLRVLVGVFVTG
jgi:uncharacterized Zn-binding protein involved in type VI secretion